MKNKELAKSLSVYSSSKPKSRRDDTDKLLAWPDLMQSGGRIVCLFIITRLLLQVLGLSDRTHQSIWRDDPVFLREGVLHTFTLNNLFNF